MDNALADDVSLALQHKRLSRGYDSASEVLREELDLVPDPPLASVLSALPEDLRAPVIVADQTTADCKYVRDVDETARTILYREPADERVMLEVTVDEEGFTARGLDESGSIVDVAGGRVADGQVAYWTPEAPDVAAIDAVSAIHEHCKQTYRTWAFQEPWLSGCGVAKFQGLKID